MQTYTLLRAIGWRLKRHPAREIGSFLIRSQGWSRSELCSYRDGRLSALIAHCYENVPYYRRIMREARVEPQDIVTAADLVKLPLLTKDHVRRHAAELRATNVSDNEVHWTRTGGTTGEPIRIAKDARCSAWEGMCYERGLQWGGLAVGQARIRLFGGSLGIERTRWSARAAHVIRGDLFLPAFELRRDTAPLFVRRIQRSRARHLIGYASAIYRLAVLCNEIGATPTFEAVFPTAEQLMPEWSETIQDAFRCKILPYYGCGEVNSLGYSVPESRSYVIPEEHCLIECLRPDGSAVLSGEGRFVVTSLVNYAMPLLRYVNGDIGAIGVPEGSLPYARIERLDGRYNSLLLTDTGDLISGVIGTHVFRHVTRSVRSYRITQEEPLHVVIQVLPREGGFPAADEQLVRQLFTKHLGKRMRLTIETVASLPPLPSGKATFVINRCL